jgi:hypothetical protein
MQDQHGCRNFPKNDPLGSEIRKYAHDRPESIRNEPKWIKDCTKIRARALDFVEGRQRLWETAKSLQVVAIWTHAKSDQGLEMFQRIYNDFGAMSSWRCVGNALTSSI